MSQHLLDEENRVVDAIVHLADDIERMAGTRPNVLSIERSDLLPGMARQRLELLGLLIDEGKP